MPATRFSRVQKASAIVPLALLSVAWTASLTGVGPSASLASAETDPSGTGSISLPDGTSVPAQAIEAPASVSKPKRVSAGGVENPGDIVADSSTNGIPSAALAAYQRAESVINAADTSCNITWQLIAAIGRVESNHGRFAGSGLDDDGVATPGIFGPALDGSNGTSRISDTDAGMLDDDKQFDRAVGPLQFIPSTWAVVGVDADNDGERNPQDIDDAALATAVYLCSGDEDLSTLPGQNSAVFRYNHSQSYVDLVLSVMDNYLQGDFLSVPNAAVAGGYLTPMPVQNQGGGSSTTGPKPDRSPQTGAPQAEETTSDDTPSEPAEPATPTEPTQPSNGNGGGSGGGQGNGDDDSNDSPIKPPKVPQVPDTGIDPVDDVLTYAEAVVQCTLDGLVDNPLSLTDKFDVCVEDYTTPNGGN